tara:strand:- start:1722 stop:2066 length:345 start_codon:yes stop_codon:yes gene_type:complete
MELDIVGKWAFIIGLIIAILAAFITNVLAPANILGILFVLGLIVGFLNIDKKNITEFLVAIIALGVTAGSLGAIALIGGTLTGYISSILENFLVFIGAAGLVVSIKAILVTSKK